jgi:hypothetical protein
MEIGDRVRIIASNNVEVEIGSKGTIFELGQGKAEVRMDATLDDWLFAEEQLEKIEPLTVTAGTGQIETTRALYDVRYVRSGTPEELLEVEGHIRKMIDEGFSYGFVERFLMSYGYQPNVIRRAFKNLTGLEPQDVVNINYLYSPSTIPQFNLGWGKAKKGESWYFVMPMVTWYSVMHQVDDMHRFEISRHVELQDALAAARKLVTRLECWDPPVKDVKREDVVPSELHRQPQLFMKADAQVLDEILAVTRSPMVRKTMLEGALRSGSISQPDYDLLMQVHGDSKKDAENLALMKRLQDIDKQEKNRDPRDVMSEKSPQERFERQQMKDQFSSVPAAAVDAISRYLAKRNDVMQGFTIMLPPLIEYVPLEPTPSSGPTDEADVLHGIASVTAIFQIMDRTAPAPKDSMKKAYMVFSIGKDGKVESSDTVVGDDGVQYGLSDDGFSKYFAVSRQTSQTQLQNAGE